MNEHIARLGERLQDQLFIYLKMYETDQRAEKMHGPDYLMYGVPVSERMKTTKANIERIKTYMNRPRA